MKILITGGTGLIGRTLIQQLINEHSTSDSDINAVGHNEVSQITVFTRSIKSAQRHFSTDAANTANITPVKLIDSLPTPEQFDFDIVVNLAGEPIADKRWSDAQKNKICQSRWQITQQLADLIEQSPRKPSVFLSGSAIGYYGRQETSNPKSTQITETEYTINDEFTHQVCKKWEKIALSTQPHTRVCVIRTGVVLANKGGALAKMKPAYLIGAGGPLGNGEQIMSWIDLTDQVNAILFLINNQTCQGIYNLTAPNPVSNNEFSQTLATALHRPNLFRMPACILKLLMGEMSDLLLTGQNVKPKRLIDQGFEFTYPTLQLSLQHVLK